MSERKDLFTRVMWFDRRERFDIDYFDMLLPQRTVSCEERYKSGLFWSQKCGRYIQHESGLELAFIEFLERSEKVVFYFEQPVRIKYWRGRRKVSYTPDFGVYLASREFVLVEVKDLHGMPEDRVQLKTEALMEFCSNRGFGLLLTDGRHTFDKVRKIKLNRRLEREVLRAIDQEKVLRKRQYAEMLKSCRASHSDILRIVLKHDLKYRAYPFKLERGGRNELFRAVFVERQPYDQAVARRQPEWLMR